jgi:hypothetical protein
MTHYARAHNQGWYIWRKSDSGSVLFCGWFKSFSGIENVEVVS